MEIKKATLEDYESVLSLKIKSKEEERELNKELKSIDDAKMSYAAYLRNDLRGEWRSVFIAKENTKIIGMIVGKIYRSLKIAGYERCGHISNLYIEKDFRKKGISKKLVDELTDWFKKRDVKKLTLELYENNNPAINLYHNLGFKNYSIKMKKSI
ncbi:MAG: GNAT family N-acetyltransferase [Nanoarchaeota archaeon]